MSAQAQTYFCENGHVVLEVEHGFIPERYPKICSKCNSTNIRVVLEWKDPDYWDGQGDHPLVSLVPIKWVKKTIEVDIPVYGVSNLFSGSRGKLHGEGPWDGIL